MSGHLIYNDKLDPRAPNRTLYVLQVEDLIDSYNAVAKEENEDLLDWRTLSDDDKDDLIMACESMLESWAGDSQYNWADVLDDSIRETVKKE